ncbi:MAG TPA: hypothetical protein VGQ04_04000, partial [Chitinophagaceae bacterium]|nr:hypothetical protein [Chitinophagaceae bacterium]
MSKIILLLLLLLSSFFSNSQTTDTSAISNNNTIYDIVDSAATFPGGKAAWYKFVENNLNPNVGVENSAKKGTYKVKIKFTVTKDGTLR